MALLDLNKKVTRDLPIQPMKDEKGNWKNKGLNPVAFVGVELGTQTNEKGEFAGIEQTVLKFHFEELHTPNDPDRFFTFAEKIIGTVQGEDMEQRPVEDIQKNIEDSWARIKHMLDGCSKSPTFRDIAKVSKKDQEKYFDLPATGDPATRVAKWAQFFGFLAKFINGDETTPSMCIGAKGEYLVTGWMKLLPNYPKKQWYTIPTWVGTGFFESSKIINPTLMTLAPAKVISVNPVSESLELAKAAVANNPVAMPGAPGGEINNDVMNFLNQNQ